MDWWSYEEYRINRSAKPWVHVRLDSFCQLTGLSIRTAKRALDVLRDGENDLVIRTIHQDRRWKIVCSTTERLYGLQRSEPFNMSEDGLVREKGMIGVSSAKDVSKEVHDFILFHHI